MAMEAAATVTVQVACALPDRQRVVTVTLPAGATAREAVAASGLQREFPELDLAACDLGIYGHAVPDQRPVAEGDRVEILRPLVRDPREARRLAAARGEVLGGRRAIRRPTGRVR
jgi:putative ubiquitin-RnfH superfamily antitoxin RatB of RatAB toxin-antitoxin module